VRVESLLDEKFWGTAQHPTKKEALKKRDV